MAKRAREVNLNIRAVHFSEAPSFPPELVRFTAGESIEEDRGEELPPFRFGAGEEGASIFTTGFSATGAARNKFIS